jgi:hypothetical protein
MMVDIHGSVYVSGRHPRRRRSFASLRMTRVLGTTWLHSVGDELVVEAARLEEK